MPAGAFNSLAHLPWPVPTTYTGYEEELLPPQGLPVQGWSDLVYIGETGKFRANSDFYVRTLSVLGRFGRQDDHLGFLSDFFQLLNFCFYIHYNFLPPPTPSISLLTQLPIPSLSLKKKREREKQTSKQTNKNYKTKATTTKTVPKQTETSKYGVCFVFANYRRRTCPGVHS